MHQEIDQEIRKWLRDSQVQKTLWTIALAIKTSLTVENRSEYTNYQMNNRVKS